jgi:hypothetical protein
MTRRQTATIAPNPDPTVLKIDKVLMSAIVEVDGVRMQHTPVTYLDERPGFPAEEALFIFFIEADNRALLTFPLEGTHAEIAAQCDQRRRATRPEDAPASALVEAAQLVSQCADAHDRAQLIADCESEWTWMLQHGTLDDATHEGHILAAVRALLGQPA